jgi:hypothetical protein
MSVQVPVMTQKIDDAFTHTWYEIQKQAVDNILDANVVTAALKEKGAFKAQVGGRFITKTLRYGKKMTQEIAKGSILSSGEDEIETTAMWRWKYFSSHVQRSQMDDQQNNGKAAIKSLVQTKISAAKDALQEKVELVTFNPYNASGDEESSKTIQGLNDLIPPKGYEDADVTYGGINRSTNSWWRSNYAAFSPNPEVHLLSDMKSMFNTCTSHIEAPNLIIASKTKFELFEDFALDMSQIVVKDSGTLADLGYRVLQFKGTDLVWVPDERIKISGKDQMLFLNTNFIEFVYDPQLWFAMTNWKDIPLQTERIAHILCAANMIGFQPRRQGRIYES